MSLSDRIRPNSEAAPWVIEEVKGLEANLATSRAETNQLNNLLRAVGWGQGEIDSAACIEEENEKLRKVILMAADWMFAVSCGTEKAQMHEVEDELRAALVEKP